MFINIWRKHTSKFYSLGYIGIINRAIYIHTSLVGTQKYVQPFYIMSNEFATAYWLQ